MLFKWDNGVCSDHTRDDVRTQSSKDSSLCYRTKTTSRSDFQGCGCSPHLIHNVGASIPNIPRKGAQPDAGSC